MRVWSFLFVISLFYVNDLSAWGQRGHRLITSMAARSMPKIYNHSVKEKAFSKYMFSHSLMLALMSQMPDVSWKDKYHKGLIVDVNRPNHYLDVEALLGMPSTPIPITYLNQIRSLPLSYKDLKKKFQGKVPAVKEWKNNNQHPFFFYKHVGSAPWRVGELSQLAIEILKCAKGKKPFRKKKTYPPVDSLFSYKDSPFRAPYSCKSSHSYYEDLFEATRVMGVLAHFVGDLSQPNHVSLDYDGYLTGQGGLHAYFESAIVSEIGEDLPLRVMQKLLNHDFRKKALKALGPSKNPVRISLALAANSYSRLPELRRIDAKWAVVQKGQSDLEAIAKRKGAAKRKSAENPKVYKAFEPFVVERLAMASLALSEIWKHIWTSAGKLNFEQDQYVVFPYIQDMPFIWPQFDKGSIRKILSKKTK